MKVVSPKDISAVLQVTDELGIHREAVRVPLAPVPGGALRIASGKLVIELPESDVDQFVAGLPERLRALPGLDRLRRAE